MSQSESYEYPYFNNLPKTCDDAPLVSQKHVRAEYYLNLGNRHYSRYQTASHLQDLDMAIAHYRRALENDPNLAEAYSKLALVLWEKGEITIETAIHYCEVALKLNPEYAEGRIPLGKFYQISGRIDEALRQFATAVQKAPMQSAKARISLGHALIEKASRGSYLGAYERIILTYQGLITFTVGCVLLPADKKFQASLPLALLMDLQVYSLIGLGRMFQWVGLTGVTAQIYRLGTQQLPTEPVFHHLLADLYNRHNAGVAAIEHYQEAIQLDPNNLELYKKLGKQYLLTHDTESALKTLEKVLEVDSEDFEALYHTGRVYAEREELMRALYYLKEASRQEPENPYVHSHMAYVLFKMEDYDGAIEEYQTAIQYGEDAAWTSTVAQTLAVLYYQVKHNISMAIEMFQIAYQMDPSNLDCMAMLADLFVEQGDLEAGIRAYQHILEYEPENAQCYCYMGYLLWQMGQNEEALDAYLTAIHYDAENYIAYNNLGVIYLDEYQNPTKADELFQKALEIKPTYTLACFNLGRTQDALGDQVQAAKTYSEALSLNVESPEIEDQEILDRLDGLFRLKY